MSHAALSRRVAALSRRVAALTAEAKASQPRQPWFLEFAQTLSGEEYETEANWIVPTLLRSFIRGGMPGYPLHDGRGGLAEHPEMVQLWGQWHTAYQRVSQKTFVSWWSVSRQQRDFSPDAPVPECPVSWDLYDFWTARGDEEQEHLRQQIVERLLLLLPEPVREFLTQWEPSDPAACTTHPSQRYFEWRASQATKR